MLCVYTFEKYMSKDEFDLLHPIFLPFLEVLFPLLASSKRKTAYSNFQPVNVYSFMKEGTKNEGKE